MILRFSVLPRYKIINLIMVMIATLLCLHCLCSLSVFCTTALHALYHYGDWLFSGDNLDKQLVRYQCRRKGQVIQPFHGDVTDYIHSQEAASMSPPSNRG